MTSMVTWVKRSFDRFLFETCDPRIVPVLRIGFGLIILVHALVMWPDAYRWYSDDGVLRVETAKHFLGPSAWSLLFVLPSTELIVRCCLGAMVVHASCMILGVYSRFQSAAIFLWLVSFQNRNPFVIDGEDTLMRMFAFFLLWMPLDSAWSILRCRNGSQESNPSPASAWGLRLMQFQMAALYASTAICKLEGITWSNGTATWYVSRMADNYGRWIPATWFDVPNFVLLTTWGALFIEASLPIALWFRSTRKFAILAGIALHLGIEVSMNLFLFQWLMILGLMSFVRFDEWKWLSWTKQVTASTPVPTDLPMASAI